MNQTDVLQEILKDHEEIKSLLAAVETSNASARPVAFKRLVDKLKHHEAAEQRVVHPLGRKSADGEATAAQRIEEERKAETVIAKLQKLDVASPGFLDAFKGLKNAVLAHAQAEEQKEHPKIRAAVDESTLKQLAPQYLQAEGRR